MRPVMPWHCAQASCFMGVEPLMMLMACPQLTAAPQQPQKPQVPPGTHIERERISSSARGSSMPPPAFA